MRKEFVIYKRTVQGKKKLYVKFWNHQKYTYDRWTSIGSLYMQLGEKAKNLSVTSKTGAETLVRLWIEEGQPERAGETFCSYLEDFWKRDSDYVRKNADEDKPISDKYVDSNRSGITKYVAPFLKAQGYDRLRISEVTTALIEELKKHLQDNSELSNRRINAIIQAVSVPLTEAERLGKIRSLPAKRVGKLKEKKKNPEILTPEEVRKFFAVEWEDSRYKAINLLAATTGMRLGECRGLLAEHLHDGWIKVEWNWQDGEGLKEPKWGSRRVVPLPSKVFPVLQTLSDQNKWGNGFVFWGMRKTTPISMRSVEDYFNRTCEVIGIKEAERQERRLTFHAWRHFFNSMLRGQIDDHVLRKLTGHKNERMTENYTSLTDDQRNAVYELADKFL